MDISDGGIVEDVDDFLPGSPMAKRGPAMRVCRLPPRRPEGHRPSLEVPPHMNLSRIDMGVVNQNDTSALLNGDDDGFAMSPRLRKKKEAAKLKKMGIDTVSGPGGNCVDRPTPGDGSNLSEKAGGGNKQMLNSNGVKKGTKGDNPLDTIVIPSSHEPEQPKDIHQERRFSSSLWGEFCTTGRDPLLGRGLSIVAGGVLHKMSVVQTKEDCDIPSDEEGAGICEEVDDFLPGSPLKRDLRVPLPRHDRNPPKAIGKKTAKCDNLPSSLIPDFTLPGSRLDDTVESSLNPRDTSLQGGRRISQERTLPLNSTGAEAKGHSDTGPRENFQRRFSRRLSRRSTVAQSRRQSVTRMCEVPNPRSTQPLEPRPPRNRSGSIGRNITTTRNETNDKTTGGVNRKSISGNEDINNRHRRNSVNKKGSSVTSDNVDHLTDISPRLRQKLEERRLSDSNTKQDHDAKYVNLPKARPSRRQSLLSDDGNDHVVDLSKRRTSNDGAGGKILPAINRAPVYSTTRENTMLAHDAPGSIVTIDEGLFLVPKEKQLPHLKWEPEQQRFVVLERDGDDLVLCLSPRETISLDYLHGIDWGDGVENIIPCWAIYGVLPIGRTSSILLYVTQREHVATLPFAGSHEIFAVKQLKCMSLASKSIGSTVSEVLKNGEKDSKEGSIQPGSLQELSEETIAEYRAVVERFCANSQRHCGGSYFFYSPTINLALDPYEMINKRRNSFTTTGYEPVDTPLTRTVGMDRALDENLTTVGVFQWNAPLLKAFDTPDESISSDNYFFTPSFIRGVVTSSSVPTDGVELLLINRLSYRWSGTRYNRRGLDSNGTGIPANFSVSTLWVFPIEGKQENNNNNNNNISASLVYEKRVATFSILRGSIPRRWNQPANLSFKPNITILSSSSGVSEFVSHLKFLQGLLHGISSLECMDTTSCSRLELPLSKGFEKSFLEQQESESKYGNSLDVRYCKYDVKSRKKRLSYDAMKLEVNALLRMDEDGNSDSVDFSQWCAHSVLEEDVISDVNEEYPLEWKRIHQQEHYVRVNCLDCLDRTNLVQSMIAIGVLPRMIRYVHGVKECTNAEKINNNNNNNKNKGSDDYINCEFNKSKMQCKQMWVQQGIAISQLYAGSDPHFVNYLLKGQSGFRDKCEEGILALKRWIQQNLYDGDKQDAISLITCQHNPALFHSEFESPFSRRLSGLNKMVALGFFIAFVPLVLNIILAILYPKYRIRQEFLLFDLLWCIYLFLWVSHIRKEGIDYTNYPLLQ